jgi:ribosomal protein S18 acetylase RimI-like enzyme
MLRTAKPVDFSAIRDVVNEVWPIAYKEMISSEQISYMLNMMYSDESLDRQMAQEGCEFILSVEEGITVGFASYSQVEQDVYKLHKLYVLSRYQGKGIGKMLLDEVKYRVKSREGKSIELQVNKRNSAIHFYQAQAFSIDRELVVDIGNGFVMDDFVMRHSLV